MSIVIICFIIVFICYFIQAKYNLFLTGQKIVGPWAFPLLGNVQMISKLKPEYLFLFMTENRAKFRQTYRLWLGPQLWVFLHSPQETKDALNDSSLKRADTFQQLSLLIGNGLLISEGKIWETHRRALGPAFHPNILNSFAPVINHHADELIHKLNSKLKTNIEASEYLFPCILDIIIDTSMGKNLKSQYDQNGTYTHAFHRTSELLFKRMVNPLLAFDFIFKYTKMHRELQNSINVIHELMDNVIQERKLFLSAISIESSNLQKNHRTLLDILLTINIEGRHLTFQEIRDEVNTFVFAGVDTTTAAMSFVFYSLAKYPIEQKRIHDEIKNLLNTRNLESCTEFSIDHLNSLKYLDLFLKECLRYYTIVPMTGRQTTRETKIGQIKYCAGITLWINMYGLAHDPDLFDDPYVFKPMRFSEEYNGPKIQPFSYLPFSGGPHVCIGRKYALLIMKILTVKIIQNFILTLSNPDEDLVLMSQMVLKSLNGINLKFEKRC